MKSKGKIELFLDKNSFWVSLVGLCLTISSGLFLYEDILSSAKTLFEYVPVRYGVEIVTTQFGANLAGVFLTLSQIGTMFIIGNRDFSGKTRLLASLAFLVSVYLDNWTDIAYRSRYFTGDVYVATASTLWFYTFGSELLSGMGLMLFVKYIRRGYSQFLFGIASIGAFINVQKREWNMNKKIANRKESAFISEMSKRLDNSKSSRPKNAGTTRRKELEGKYRQNKPSNSARSSRNKKRPKKSSIYEPAYDVKYLDDKGNSEPVYHPVGGGHSLSATENNRNPPWRA